MTVFCQLCERKRRGKIQQHEDPGNFEQGKKEITQRMIMILAIITGFRYWPERVMKFWRISKQKSINK